MVSRHIDDDFVENTTSSPAALPPVVDYLKLREARLAQNRAALRALETTAQDIVPTRRTLKKRNDDDEDELNRKKEKLKKRNESKRKKNIKRRRAEGQEEDDDDRSDSEGSESSVEVIPFVRVRSTRSFQVEQEAVMALEVHDDLALIKRGKVPVNYFTVLQLNGLGMATKPYEDQPGDKPGMMKSMPLFNENGKKSQKKASQLMRWEKDEFCALGSQCMMKNGQDCCGRLLCHFCRHRSRGDAKPTCVQCGVSYCGPCLSGRHGESVFDIIRPDSENWNMMNPMENAQINVWKCPLCRGLCNCSGTSCFRIKKMNWPATGQLASIARTENIESAQHYLVCKFFDSALEDLRQSLEGNNLENAVHAYHVAKFTKCDHAEGAEYVRYRRFYPADIKLVCSKEGAPVPSSDTVLLPKTSEIVTFSNGYNAREVVLELRELIKKLLEKFPECV